MSGSITKPDARQDAVSDEGLRMFTGYVMKRAFNVIQSDVNRTLKPFGLRMVTFSALTMIVNNPGLRQAQLADALAIERPNLVLIVDELEQAGLIARKPAPHDRRAYALQATPEGQKRHAAAHAAARCHNERVTRDLSDSERAALMRALHSIERIAEREEDHG